MRTSIRRTKGEYMHSFNLFLAQTRTRSRQLSSQPLFLLSRKPLIRSMLQPC
jgi:hypothetical protein